MIFTIDAPFFERRRAKDLAASFFSATLSTRCMAIFNTIDVNLIQSSEEQKKKHIDSIRIQLDASLVHWFHKNRSVEYHMFQIELDLHYTIHVDSKEIFRKIQVQCLC